MSTYYNENDPFAAAWLRELIKDGLIAPGDVDERSIEDVNPDDVAPYTQCHFFAGIGGWSAALRLAGWPDSRPVWTGSAPCQPFSEAGKGGGFTDDRHLWPAFYWLIQQCRPAIVFGEQVASKAGLEWWDVVATDLEAAAYACAAFDIPAAGVGAFHRRQRLYWVADAECPQRGAGAIGRSDDNPKAPQRDKGTSGIRECGEAGGLAHTASQRRGTRGAGTESQRPQQVQRPERLRAVGAVNFWSDAEWIICRDGKGRPTRPGLSPLAHGVPNRVGILRGAGNAIVPQVAAVFIEAYMGVAG